MNIIGDVEGQRLHHPRRHRRHRRHAHQRRQGAARSRAPRSRQPTSPTACSRAWRSNASRLCARSGGGVRHHPAQRSGAENRQSQGARGLAPARRGDQPHLERRARSRACSTEAAPRAAPPRRAIRQVSGRAGAASAPALELGRAARGRRHAPPRGPARGTIRRRPDRGGLNGCGRRCPQRPLVSPGYQVGRGRLRRRRGARRPRRVPRALSSFPWCRRRTSLTRSVVPSLPVAHEHVLRPTRRRPARDWSALEVEGDVAPVGGDHPSVPDLAVPLEGLRRRPCRRSPAPSCPSRGRGGRRPCRAGR